jgi:hypothetical protein
MAFLCLGVVVVLFAAVCTAASFGCSRVQPCSDTPAGRTRRSGSKSWSSISHISVSQPLMVGSRKNRSQYDQEVAMESCW